MEFWSSPTVAELPPKIGAKEIQSEDYQIRSCSFSSVASMSGGCQVNAPLLSGTGAELANTKSSASGNALSKGNICRKWLKKRVTKPSKRNSGRKPLASTQRLSNSMASSKPADSSKAIGLDKKNVKAYLRRGNAREMLGYYKEAIEDFRYALVLEPTNKRASQSADRLKKWFP
ncbi:hypothetical protein HAX54_012247 [Datura stramonium]|uniref:Uncharacterized protein n=1 Tax=Datura stramonium TaxID=4076 RepID=A0ABS8Y2J3_DATST|nr:hypothetical protein [Datura stramonium]